MLSLLLTAWRIRLCWGATGAPIGILQRVTAILSLPFSFPITLWKINAINPKINSKTALKTLDFT